MAGQGSVALDDHVAVEHPRNIPDDVRSDVYERDNHQCQSCGAIRNLHIHHWLHYRSGGGGHEPRNLVTVCWVCHERIHAHEIDIELQWVLGRWHAFVTRRK